jgi:hypothetical protein
MKQYEVELRRISYVVADVEANDKDEAIQKAFEQLDVHESDWKY